MNGLKKKAKLFLAVSMVLSMFALQMHAQAEQGGMHGHPVVDQLADHTGDALYNFDTLDAALNGLITNGHIGTSVLVVKDGAIVKESYYGYKAKYEAGLNIFDDHQSILLDQSDWKLVDQDTLWDLASVTKMLSTNLALQKLVYEGKLDIKEKVSTYIPSFKDYEEVTSLLTPQAQQVQRKDLVTVEMLLQHVAGQAPDPQYHNDNYLKSENAKNYMGFAEVGDAYDVLYVSPQTDPSDRAAILEAIVKTPLTTYPGTALAYSDVDYMLLGLIVEAITGKPLDEYVETEIYQPLGLENTMYNPLKKGKAPSDFAATEINGNSRDGYRTVDNKFDNDEYAFTGMRTYTLQGEVHDEKAYYAMAGVAGHAGLFSTPKDIAVLYQLMLNNGTYNGVTLFDKATVDLFLTPGNTLIHSSGYTRNDYALGWNVNDVYYSGNSTGWPSYFSNYASYETFGHQGWTGPLTYADPVNNLIVVYMRNRPHNPVVSSSQPNSFQNAGTSAQTYLKVAECIYRDALGFTEFVSFLPDIGAEREAIIHDFNQQPTLKVDVEFIDPVNKLPITRIGGNRKLRVTRVDVGSLAPAIPTSISEPLGSEALIEPSNDSWVEGGSYSFNATAPGDYYISLFTDRNPTINDGKIQKYIRIVDRNDIEASVSLSTELTTNQPVTATLNVSGLTKTPLGWNKIDDTTYTKVYEKNTVEVVSLNYALGVKDEITVNIDNIVNFEHYFIGKSTYSKGSNEPLIYYIDKDLTPTLDVLVDGESIAINEDKILVEMGSTKITIQSEYLNTLSTGVHKIQVQFDQYNQVAQNFTVADNVVDADSDDDLPSTGYRDITSFYVIAFFVGTGLLISLTLDVKNRKGRNFK